MTTDQEQKMPVNAGGASAVDPRLLELLVCPLTKTSLVYDRERQELVSHAAHLAYQIRDGIPIMLPEEARPLEDQTLRSLAGLAVAQACRKPIAPMLPGNVHSGGETSVLVYDLLKYLHVLGAIVILGTGTGIAFFMVMANRSGEPAFVARTAAVVVTADAIFTATAVVAQPITGFLLARQTGVSLLDPWVAASLLLYVITGLVWLPVLWIQIRMRDLAAAAAAAGQGLPPAYHRLYRLWFGCGIPGFGSVSAILWLMIAKPPL